MEVLLACLSVCLTCQSTAPRTACVYRSYCLPDCLSVCGLVRLFCWLPSEQLVYMEVLPDRPTVCLSVHLSVCLSCTSKLISWFPSKLPADVEAVPACLCACLFVCLCCQCILVASGNVPCMYGSPACLLICLSVCLQCQYILLGLCQKCLRSACVFGGALACM